MSGAAGNIEDDGEGGGPSGNSSVLLDLLRPLLMQAGEAEDQENSEEAEELEAAVQKICDDMAAVESECGSNPTEYSQGDAKKLRDTLLELGTLLHKETDAFEEKYVKTFDGSQGRRLHRIRRCLTSTNPDRIETIISAALLPGVDVFLSCTALYILRHFSSAMLTPGFGNIMDPLGLGQFRINLKDSGSGRDVVRLIQMAVRPVEVSEGTDPSPRIMQRALATSVLRGCVRDVDIAQLFFEDLSNLKHLLHRLWNYWFGGARPSPKRPGIPRRAPVSPLRQPLTLSPKTSPGGGQAPASPAGPGPGPADRLVLPLRAVLSPRSPPSRPAAPRRQQQQQQQPLMPTAVPFPTSPRRASTKRPHEEVDQNEEEEEEEEQQQQPVQQQDPVQQEQKAPRVPKRRALAARISRVSRLVQDKLLFPTGCNPKAPPQESLQDLDTMSIMQVLAGIGTYKEMVAPVLQNGVLDVLLRVLNPNPAAREKHSHELVITGYNLAFSLLTHKKFCMLFVDSHGVEQVLVDARIALDKGLAAVLHAQGSTLVQLSKSSVLERFAASHHSSVPSVMSFCIDLLRWGDPSPASQDPHPTTPAVAEIRGESASILSHALSIPCFINAFDEIPNGLSTLVEALDLATKSTDCSTNLEASLADALSCYAKSHLLLACCLIWPTHRKLGHHLRKNVYRSLPVDTGAVGVVVTHLEQQLAVTEESNGPARDAKKQKEELLAVSSGMMPGAQKTGMSQLTRNKMHAFARIESLGTVSVVVHLIRAASRFVAPQTLDSALTLLELLSAVPFLHHPIASCKIEEVGAPCGLGLLLEVASETWNDIDMQQPLPRHLNRKALNTIRQVTTPCEPPSEDAWRPYSEIWELFRSNNGVRVVLAALEEKDTVHGDAMRYTACRVLLNMCSEPELRKMLYTLGVSKTLLDLQSDPVSDDPDHYELFRATATKVVSLITGWQHHPASIPVEHALQRLEKSVVVQNADIDFHSSELLSMVHEYLRSCGLNGAAESLQKEAGLTSSKTTPGPLRPLHDLPDIVKSFLRQQHLACPNPISTLPTFSLRKGAQPALRAAVASRGKECNVALRVLHKLSAHSNRTKHDLYDRKLIYSRLKPNLLYRGDSFVSVTSIGFSNEGDSTFVGLSNGSVLQFDIQSPVLKDPVEFELLQEPVTGLRPSQLSDIMCVWTADKVSFHAATDLAHRRCEVGGYRGATFAHRSATAAVLTSSESNSASFYDLEARKVVRSWPERDMDPNESNLAILNATDTIVLSDAVLYDVRCGSGSIYRYDKLVQHSRGIFSASQNEVVIDKEVWDIRTHKLVCTIPSLACTRMTLSPHGHVIYGTRFEVVDPEIGEQPKNSMLSVVDGQTFEPILAHDMIDTIEDFTTDTMGSFLGMCTQRDNETCAKLFQVGKARRIVESGDDSQSTEEDIEGDHEEEEEEIDEEEDDSEFPRSDDDDDDDSGEMIADWTA